MTPSEVHSKTCFHQIFEGCSDIAATHTNVTIEIPEASPKPDVPQNVEANIEPAEEIVEKVVQLDMTLKISKISKKRKFDDVESSNM